MGPVYCLGRFGGLDVDDDKPITITWNVHGLSDAQRATLTLAHWDETVDAWQPSAIQPVWSGDTLTAQVTKFSFWDWITDIGQAAGEWTGSRAGPPTCTTDPTPAWVKGTVSPSEDTSAAAVQVCFEPDKNERATVRVTNNRTFSQVMQADGIPKWAWTWDGPEDYGVAGAVYSVGHAVLDGDTSFLAATAARAGHRRRSPVVAGRRPDHRHRPGQPGNRLRRRHRVPDGSGAYRRHLEGRPGAERLLAGLLRMRGRQAASRECHHAERKADSAVGRNTATGCGAELVDPDSEFGARFEQLSRRMIASSKMGADAAVMANRAVRRLAGYAKILTVGQVAFYASDQFANALVGPLTWSIRGSGQPPTLGQWTPTCSDLAKDSDALPATLHCRIKFTDTSKELWQFDGWESAAGTAVKPLTTCGTDYRGQLAAYLPTSWGDPRRRR